ncbi:hypothetical protein ACFLT2_04745 [Acidobacteriota bacterium]
MNTLSSRIVVCLYVVFFFLLFPRQAHAYLDLGTGSFIFQMLIATSLATLFFLKSYVRKAVKFLTGLFNKKKAVE